MGKAAKYTLAGAIIGLIAAAVGLAKEFAPSLRGDKPAEAAAPPAKSYLGKPQPPNPYLQAPPDEPPTISDPEEAEALAAWNASYHEGFRWARDRNIKDMGKCPAKKGPFRRGCLDWVAAQAS